MNGMTKSAPGRTSDGCGQAGGGAVITLRVPGLAGPL
jgi:hypothetical protein